MSDLRDRLADDRELRNSARALFSRDLAHVRREITPRALRERVVERIGEKIDAVSDSAVELVRENRGIVSGTAGAIAVAVGLWLARKPILARLRPLLGGTDETDGTDGTDDEENDD